MKDNQGYWFIGIIIIVAALYFIPTLNLFSINSNQGYCADGNINSAEASMLQFYVCPRHPTINWEEPIQSGNFYNFVNSNNHCCDFKLNVSNNHGVFSGTLAGCMIPSEINNLTSFFKCESPVCNTNWVCTNWSVCSGLNQIRTCSDLNNCGTNIGSPINIRSCTTDQDQTNITCNETSCGNYYRLTNNSCTLVQLSSAQVTSNDYASQSLCTTKITNPIEENGYCSVAKNLAFIDFTGDKCSSGSIIGIFIIFIFLLFIGGKRRR